MRKLTLVLTITILQINIVIAQSPQLAVVRPDGTTYICPTWDSAYNKSVDGDFIYLPGGNFTVTNPISKRLYIYGAGSNLDSSAATSITTISNITFEHGADNGIIEGLKISQVNSCFVAAIRFGHTINLDPINGYTISNCLMSGGIQFNSVCNNITIKNNNIGGYNCPNGGASISIGENITNSLISNNVIGGNISANGVANLQINNNLFTFVADFYSISLPYNCTYSNNIFLSNNVYVANSNFYNNVNVNPNGTGNQIFNTASESMTDIFVSPGAGPYYYDVHNDYHIKSTSICKSSGSDGTDRGFYGGTFPWKDGSIPSNPHIYFKQIDANTTSDGKLKVKFKVRTNQ